MLLFAAIAVDGIRHREEVIDDSLLLGVAEENKQAFTELYRMAGQSVYAYALSILKDPTEAEDVLQDTFLKIRSAAHLYRPMGKPMAWVLTITRNICLMKLRQRQKLSLFPLERMDEPAELDQITDLEDRMVLRTALRVLPEDECQIIVLHAVTGWKHREIAQQMELPLSTVLSKYRRGLKKLQVELEGVL